jgi:phosphonate transport system substrate-binding protein
MRVTACEFRRQTAFASALLCVALAMSCGNQEEEILIVDVQSQPAFRIGLIPERNIFSQKKRYEPIADYLSKRAGVEVELVVLSRYGNIIENFVSNDLDGAFFGSFTGALAHRKLGVEALARPEYPDGTSTYHGLIFVRRDSGIRSGDDMKGKRFAFVDKATTAGYLLPLRYFEDEGIDDYRSWFKETYFTGTHEGAIRDVLQRKADVGAAKNTVFNMLASHEPEISDELMILTRSPDVPENALLVRSDLDDEIKSRLKEALLNMTHDAEGREVLKELGAARFIETVEADYAPVFDFAEEIGLDLETYDYIND